MNRVVTINLNGNAFQVDEAGYDALREYLDRAESQLKDNPDRAEIMLDFEQAIAEKCARFLRPHKTVVTAAEILQIIMEMGPVEPDSDRGEEHRDQGTKADAGTPRRLYQIREGAMLSGVCNGLAAYFGVDVTIVRIAFLLLAIFTKGIGGLLYLILMFIIPHADTPEERAAAHGKAFNAQELIDQAKKNYANFRNEKDHWKNRLKQQHILWKRKWREESPWWGRNIRESAGYATQQLSGVNALVFAVLNSLFMLTALFAVISLLMTGAIFGWPLPEGIPIWVGILGILLISHVLRSQMRAVFRNAYVFGGGRSLQLFEMWSGLFSLGFLTLGLWFAYYYVPGVQELVLVLTDIVGDWF